jgi:hypothetical protein
MLVPSLRQNGETENDKERHIERLECRDLIKLKNILKPSYTGNWMILNLSLLLKCIALLYLRLLCSLH